MVSVVILAKNEESTIKACLESVAFADERIVIDDYSSDKTAEIAREMGAKVFKHPLQNDFSQQRNFGLEKAGGEWVLFVDADEKVGHSLQYEITEEVNNPMNINKGYYVKRFDTIWEKRITFGEIGSVLLLRLARRDAGKWYGKVHETWKVHGKTERLHHQLDHFPHQSVKEFLRSINYYSSLRAQELYKKKRRTNRFEIICYPLGKFMVNYFFRLGFLDGIHGLIIAIMMSFHSFLVRGKLWLLTQKKSV